MKKMTFKYAPPFTSPELNTLLNGDFFVENNYIRSKQKGNNPSAAGYILFPYACTDYDISIEYSVSSEAGYDFGECAIGTEKHDLVRTNDVNTAYASGKYVFACGDGSNTKKTATAHFSYNDPKKIYLCFAYMKDGSRSGGLDGLFIYSITITATISEAMFILPMMNPGIAFDGSTSYATIPAANIIGGLDAWHLEFIFSTESIIAKTNWYTMPTLITGWNGSTGATTGFGLGIDGGKLHIWTRTTTHKVDSNSSDGITSNSISDGLKHKAIVKFVKAKEYSASVDGVEFYKDTANDATWGTGDLYIGKCQTESVSLLAFNFYSLKFYDDTKKELIADYTVTNRRIDDDINNKKISSSKSLLITSSAPPWRGSESDQQKDIPLDTSLDNADNFDISGITFNGDNLITLKGE